MGSRGPVPGEKSRLKGHISREKRESVTHAFRSEKVTIPGMSPKWCPAAKRLWKAAKESGQAQFYESTDWAWLHFQCDLITKAMAAPKPPAQLIAGINAEINNLMFTEGARRRLALELHKPVDEIQAGASNVEVMNEWREKLAGGTR